MKEKYDNYFKALGGRKLNNFLKTDGNLSPQKINNKNTKNQMINNNTNNSNNTNKL